MSDFHDVEGSPIPLLNETLVPGNLLRGRDASPFEKAAAAHQAAAVPDPMPTGESDSLPPDAEALVERLSGRAMGWLTGEGRSVIEQRCAAALQEHSHWIVGQVSREIGLALETELKGWVKAALREELAARAGKSTPPEV
ncbi:DUF2486 family protein [Paraburkholderia silviterrae]|uniref:DUF2486 family protein n=1 Tax=Paraburkholderia silviterrae TaxID=2528715 RepID=A0A4R5M644_9BURK|nr:DUF2486 family protein [Paraburkholderia silviterrae]TDG20800.1 DUF2486 family protein [Paraburkholderia silviterrae]